MGLFETMPYVNFQDLNLDGLIRSMKTLSATVKSFDIRVEDLEKFKDNILKLIGDNFHIQQYVDDWLSNNPEAYTTVLDNSLTLQKFTEQLKLQTINYEITPQLFGAVADGLTDDTIAIQDALNSGFPVYFPAGTYLVTSPLQVSNSIYGSNCIRMNSSESSSNIIYDGDVTNSGLLQILSGSDTYGITIQNINLTCNSKCRGIDYITPEESGKVPLYLQSINIMDCYNYGLYLNPASAGSRFVHADNIFIHGGNTESVGIYIGEHCIDSSFSNIEIMYCPIGIHGLGGGIRLENCHIYVGRAGIIDMANYYPTTCGIKLYRASLVGSNIYVDSGYYGIYADTCNCILGNVFSYYDSFMGGLRANSLLCAVNKGSITCGNISLSGTLTALPDISSGNVKYAHDTITSIGYIPTSSNNPNYKSLPMLNTHCINSNYVIKPSANLQMIACIEIFGSGICRLTATRNLLATEIVLTKNGSTITVEGHTVPGFSSLTLWQGQFDNYITIYGYVYQDCLVECDISTETSIGYIAPLDFSGFPYMQEYIGDLDVLNLITIT